VATHRRSSDRKRAAQLEVTPNKHGRHP